MGLDRGIRLLIACSSGLGLGGASGCAFDSESLGGAATAGGESSSEGTGGSTSLGETGEPTGSHGTTEGGPGSDGSPTDDGGSTSGTEGTSETTAGESTDDSTGGVNQVFVDTGLLVRYFIDESDQGTEIKTLLDAASDPLDLPVEYVGALTFAEVDGQRGLRWDAVGQDGGPLVSVAETKLAALDGATEATLEVVVDVEAVADTGSRFVHFGFDIASDFALAAEAMDEVHLRAANMTVAQWPVDLAAEGRVVLTAVFDPQQAEAGQRFRLYVDGTEVEGTVDEDVEISALGLADMASMALGNRSNGQRSFSGMLHYAAVYEQALSPAEIQSNASLLRVSDDRP